MDVDMCLARCRLGWSAFSRSVTMLTSSSCVRPTRLALLAIFVPLVSSCTAIPRVPRHGDRCEAAAAAGDTT
jgi:hypothetical protein